MNLSFVSAQHYRLENFLEMPFFQHQERQKPESTWGGDLAHLCSFPWLIGRTFTRNINSYSRCIFEVWALIGLITLLKWLPGCARQGNEGNSQLLCRREQSQREPGPCSGTGAPRCTASSQPALAHSDHSEQRKMFTYSVLYASRL